MQDSDKLLNIDKEIKILETKLNDIAVQLAGVFLDERQKLDGNSLIEEIETLEAKIPEIKEDMIRIQGYTQSITKSEEQIKKCNEQIKGYESVLNSLYEKIGIELYSTISEEDKEYPDILSCCQNLKDLEKRSESLESKLYKEENSVSKKKFLDKALLPFKLGAIKKDLKRNNKDILDKFRDMGKVFTSIPELMKSSSRESLNGLVEEYQSMYKLLNNQIEKRALLNSGIEEKNKKIQEDSKGLKLKTLYSNLENEIVGCQNMITAKLEELGHFLFNELEDNYDNSLVRVKLELYSTIKKDIDLKREESTYYNNRIRLSLLKRESKDRQESIELEENHIKECRRKLTKHKKDLVKVNDEISELDDWLKANSMTSEP